VRTAPTHRGTLATLWQTPSGSKSHLPQRYIPSPDIAVRLPQCIISSSGFAVRLPQCGKAHPDLKIACHNVFCPSEASKTACHSVAKPFRKQKSFATMINSVPESQKSFATMWQHARKPAGDLPQCGNTSGKPWEFCRKELLFNLKNKPNENRKNLLALFA
jgi:hypothetical protein